MPTAARPTDSLGSHWYTTDGKPCYEVPYADASKGMRPTTLRDARKLWLLPSATTLLRVLDKPALTAWKVEMAVLSVLTAPRGSGEAIDAFVKRVLQDEKQQDAQAEKARQLGTDIHDAIEKVLSGFGECPPLLAGYVSPVISEVMSLGRVIATEKIVVGNGYAGKLDAMVENDEAITVLDFKTTGTLPDKSWPEARLQLAAYAAALGNTGSKRIQTANIYISTKEPGQVAVYIHDDWQETFNQGFVPLQQVWCWLNNYNV